MNFAAQLTKMIDAGLGREVSPPETNVAIGYHTEYTDIADAAIASFQTNIEAPLKALSVAMEPIQSGSGDPSPDNVRPISGRQSVTVTRAGKNLLDYATFSVGTISSSTGEAMSASNRLRSDFIRVASGKYTLSSVNGFDVVFDVYDMQKNYVRSESNADWQTMPHTYTVIGDRYVRLLFRKSDNSSITLDELTGEQMEFNSTATSYEAPDIQTITVQLGQTVYGGTVDAVSGVMTVTWGETNLGSLTWTMLSDSIGNFFRADASYIKPIPSGDISTMKCSIYKTVSSSNVVDKSIARSTGTTNYLYCRDNSYADAASFTAAIDGVQLVYELARPVTVQLTAQQLTTLLGTNNVWSDSGNVSLTYGENVYTEGY